MTQIILEDTTETLYSDIPARLRVVPASVVVRIQTPSTPLPSSTEAATVGTTAMATNAAALAGTTSLSFATSKDPVAGRPYLLFPNGSVDADDAGEAIIVRFASSGAASLNLEQPLPVAVASGAELIPYFVTHALTAAETSDKGKAFAQWTLTDDAGLTNVWVEDFRIAEQRSVWTLSEDELQARIPQVMDWLPASMSLTELIESAWLQELRPALQRKGLIPSRIRNWDELKTTHADACRLFLLRDRADPDVVGAAESKFADSFEAAITSKEWWYTEAESLENHNDAQDYSLAGVRLTR